MWMRRQKLWVAAIVAAALLGGAGNTAVAMNMRLLVERLLADLVPFISDPNTALALVKVVSAKWSQGPVRENQVGVIALEIIEVFRGPRLKPRETIEVHGERLADEQARFKSSFNQWNVLRFEQGDLLLMALRQGSGSWQALAAQQVSWQTEVAGEVSAGGRHASSTCGSPNPVSGRSRPHGDQPMSRPGTSARHPKPQRPSAKPNSMHHLCWRATPTPRRRH
jgi:hypothetical protein